MDANQRHHARTLVKGMDTRSLRHLLPTRMCVRGPTLTLPLPTIPAHQLFHWQHSIELCFAAACGVSRSWLWARCQLTVSHSPTFPRSGLDILLIAFYLSSLNACLPPPKHGNARNCGRHAGALLPRCGAAMFCLTHARAALRNRLRTLYSYHMLA